ncbi:MAG: hypothetical protein L0191_14960, partial [Acidobacteria bacterium]|nr:hypothetical protein [Acidobacteriota bacterium]
TRSFESAVPRAVLEKKVKNYLRQSAALAEIWNMPVTSDMLRRELQCMLRDSRRPDRLRELFQALGDDPVLIQECLVRPVLVSRLANHFFKLDQNIQAGVRQGAGGLDESGTGDYAAAPGKREATRTPDAPQLMEHVNAASDRGASKIEFSQWWDLNQSRFDPASVAALPEDSVVPTLLSDWNPSAPTCSQDNTWDNGSLDDVPDPRYGHVAVWTGSLMIVWGGHEGDIVPDVVLDTEISGGLYDPATDTWAPTSRINAPVLEANPTAVWTGSQMIVWGINKALTGSTGSRYNPLTDTWSPVSTLGAPSPRQSHTAVWTGSRMLIWGG